MEIILISLIFTAVCLAVCALLIAKQNRKLKRYVEISVLEESNHRRDALRRITDLLGEKDAEHKEEFQTIHNRLKALEDGLVPDFEQAKEAAKAVNDFNKGISAIMGYDPFEARRKAQEERGDNH